jgi:hypothetical protein
VVLDRAARIAKAIRPEFERNVNNGSIPAPIKDKNGVDQEQPTALGTNPAGSSRP